MEDLGTLETLEIWLERPSELDVSAIRSVGTKFGEFLADLHLCTSGDRETLKERFANPDAKRLLRKHLIDDVPGMLKEFGIAQADEMHDILANEFREVDEDRTYHVLSVGDLVFGNVLVGDDGAKIGAIDWEFTVVAAPSQDIGQFGLVW